jgi:hypothetical protein
MTHTRNRRLACAVLAIAVAIALALALSATTIPASARTFNYNSAGSLVQQPLPARWACELSRALGERKPPCRG